MLRILFLKDRGYKKLSLKREKYQIVVFSKADLSKFRIAKN